MLALSVTCFIAVLAFAAPDDQWLRRFLLIATTVLVGFVAGAIIFAFAYLLARNPEALVSEEAILRVMERNARAKEIRERRQARLENDWRAGRMPWPPPPRPKKSAETTSATPPPSVVQ